MLVCTVKTLTEVTRGTLLWGSPDQEIHSVSTDSRNLEPGQVFFALRGPNFDGTVFAEEALRRGATGIVVVRDPGISSPPEGTFCIRVSETIQAYGDFATHVRDTLGPRVVTIAGSCGKTTTKDMTAVLLGERFNVLSTEGNYNNLIGLPKTLLRLESWHSAAVVEIGMNQPGELYRLTEIAKPNVAVLMNIVEAHIGQFGSLQRLISAKAELLQAMPGTSLLVTNGDCPHSMRALEQIGRDLQIMTFGINNPADVMVEEMSPLNPFGYRIHVNARGERAWVDLHLFGRFQAYNALASIAVGLALGVELKDAARRLSEFHPASLRTEIEEFQGIRLVKDCYNASPTATLEALTSLRDLKRAPGGRMMVLLGDMLELGNYEELYHRVVGEKASHLPLDLVVTVGERARTIHEVVNNAGLPCRHYDTADEAGHYLGEALRPNDTLFIKGSRLMKLENAVDALKKRITTVTSTSPASLV